MLAIWKSLCEEDGRDAEQTFYNAYKAEEIAELIQNHVGETIAVVFSGDIGFLFWREEAFHDVAEGCGESLQYGG